MQDASTQTEEVYAQDQLINDRWKILESIGEGNNGFVYSAIDSTESDLSTSCPRRKYALKIQRLNSRSAIIEIEVNFYQLAKDVTTRIRHSDDHILVLFDFGFHTNGAIYFVSPLLGPSLDKVVGEMAPAKKLSVCVSLRVGAQALNAIAQVHRLGYAHRNIKPSNFAFGLSHNECKLFIIDFGRVREWSDGGQSERLSRHDRYCGALWFTSLNGHAKKILTRRDDLQSWLYVLSYVVTGRLPWFDETNKETVAELKSKAEEDVKLLYGEFPRQIWDIRDYINSLSQDESPNYNLLARGIEQALMAICPGNDCDRDHYPFDETCF